MIPNGAFLALEASSALSVRPPIGPPCSHAHAAHGAPCQLKLKRAGANGARACQTSGEPRCQPRVLPTLI